MNAEERSIIDYLKNDGHYVEMGDEKKIAQTIVDRMNNLCLPFETNSIDVVLAYDAEILNPFRVLEQYDDSDEEADHLEDMPIVFVDEDAPIVFVGEFLPEVKQ